MKTVSSADSKKFVFKLKSAMCHHIQGYAAFDQYGDEVGVVYQHTSNRGELADGQAEIRFFDHVVGQYHVWRRIFIEGKRLMFDKLEQMLIQDKTIQLTIDPWNRGRE